ncbi:hypothetical protein DFJ73DRAFT_497830 [Zopfochytrium polystomum]|nr:hypothetical protein DFJ73DRAFT_497830 [Zopfochytrium polystomum]
MQTFPPVDPSTTSTTALPYQASGPSYFAPSMPYVYPNGAFYPPGTPSVTSSHNGSTKFLGYSQYPPTVYCNPYSMPGTFPGSPLGPNFINDSAAGPLPAEMQPQFIPQQAAAPCGMTGSVLTATPSFYATPPAAVSFSSNSSSVSGTATTAIPAHPPVLPIILPFPEGSSGSSNGHSPSPNPGDNVETCGLPAANTFGRSSGHQSPQGFHPGCNIQFRQSRISSTHVGFVNTPNDRHFAQNQDGVFSPPLSTPSRTPSISGRSTPAKESRPPSRPQTTTPTPGVTTSDARSESLRSSGLRRESSSTIGSTMNSTVILSPRVSGDFEVSKTNLYIRGLSATASDEWLIDLCGRFGRISSSKAIIDLNTRECKGYGFVMYETDAEAKQAMDALTNEGFQVSFAKESFNAKLKNLHDSESTNIYVSNLPLSLSEEGMLDLFSPHKVISNKILRDSSHTSRGVGFARMETREAAIAVIASLNGKMLQGSTQPLQVRFADSEGQKRLKQQQLYNSHHHSNYSPPSHRFATRPPVPSPYLPSPTGPTIASSAETPPSSARRRLFRGSFGSGSSQSVESVRAMAVTPDSTDLRPASDGAPSSDGSQRDEDESIETGAAGATEANSIPFQEPNPASSSGPPTLYSVVPTYYDRSHVRRANLRLSCCSFSLQSLLQLCGTIPSCICWTVCFWPRLIRTEFHCGIVQRKPHFKSACCSFTGAPAWPLSAVCCAFYCGLHELHYFPAS